jgi:hypothetical protein
MAIEDLQDFFFRGRGVEVLRSEANVSAEVADRHR